MIAATIANFAGGALIKFISTGLSNWMDTRRQVMLASLSADTDRLVKLQSGTDTADEMTRWTRRVIALMFSATWCYLIWFFTHHLEVKFDILVPRHQSWLWEWMWPFPVNDKGVSTVSAASLMLLGMKDMIEILVGFYFTKVGR